VATYEVKGACFDALARIELDITPEELRDNDSVDSKPHHEQSCRCKKRRRAKIGFLRTVSDRNIA
jgi:hypothetical protein